MLIVKVKIASTNKVKQQVVEQLMVDIMHGGTINGGYHALYLEKEKKKKKTISGEISCFTMVNTTQRRLRLI